MKARIFPCVPVPSYARRPQHALGKKNFRSPPRLAQPRAPSTPRSPNPGLLLFFRYRKMEPSTPRASACFRLPFGSIPAPFWLHSLLTRFWDSCPFMGLHNCSNYVIILWIWALGKFHGTPIWGNFTQFLSVGLLCAIGVFLHKFIFCFLRWWGGCLLDCSHLHLSALVCTCLHFGMKRFDRL